VLLLLHAIGAASLQVLRKGDVLMEFDGIPIANDGTVSFRARERIFFTALTTLKPTGSTARVKVRPKLAHGQLRVVLMCGCCCPVCVIVLCNFGVWCRLSLSGGAVGTSASLLDHTSAYSAC